MIDYISSFFKSSYITDEEVARDLKDTLLYELSICCVGLAYTKRECFKCSFLTLGVCDCDPNNVKINYKSIDNYKKFYKYCHYSHLHFLQNDINRILDNKKLLQQCLIKQETHCPITSVLISKSSFKEKRRLINILLSYGFQISNNCTMMIELILYEKLPTNNILLFLSSELLPEIQNIIIGNLIEMCKRKYVPITL